MLSFFDSPESSAVARAEYDSAQQVLIVELRRKDGADRYQFSGVPQKDWDDFEQAPSKGFFFATRIRPMYHGRKL